MQTDTLLDAIAEHALSCYYREAGIAHADRSEDDAFALLNGYNGYDCWVAAAERSRIMSDTRAACMAWGALASDCIGFTSEEAAGVHGDAVGMVSGDALNALRERIAAETAAVAGSGDAEALQAWRDALAIADRKAASDDERCNAYAVTAFKVSQRRAIAAANRLTLAVAEDDDTIAALADAIIATRCAPGLRRIGCTPSHRLFTAADAAVRNIGSR